MINPCACPTTVNIATSNAKHKTERFIAIACLYLGFDYNSLVNI
jgi:hypothetical protein